MKQAINGLAANLGDKKLEERNLSFSEYKLLDELVYFLAPFDLIVTDLSSSSQVTIS
jgi:hypothetical protein